MKMLEFSYSFFSQHFLLTFRPRFWLSTTAGAAEEGQVVVSEFGKKAYFSIIFFVFFLLDFFEPRPCYPRLVSFSLFRSLSLWSSLPYLLLSSLFSSRSLLLLQFSLTLQKQNLFIWVNVFSMSTPAITLRLRCIPKVWYVHIS